MAAPDDEPATSVVVTTTPHVPAALSNAVASGTTGSADAPSVSTGPKAQDVDALLKAHDDEAKSWKALDDVLVSVPPGAEERLGVAGFAELVDARAEFDEMRQKTEAAVEAAMAEGKVVRVSDGGKTCRAIATGWDHSKIATAGLQEALEQCDTFPRPSAEGIALVKVARLLVSLRDAQLGAIWLRARSPSLYWSASQ